MATILERYWSKVDKSGGPYACWPWIAGCSGNGYGGFNADGEMWGAHVYAFGIANGYKPPMVCHSCDNPPCCNPKHLWPGDALQNMLDRTAKGRCNAQKGSDRPSAKLTEVAVQEIRVRYAPRSQIDGARALAREFGVSHQLVSDIAHGRRWVHVADEECVS